MSTNLSKIWPIVIDWPLTECFGGSDENGCKFPDWLLPTMLSLTVVILALTCFIALHREVKKEINYKMQDSRWRLATQNTNSRILSMTAEKLMKVASLIENGNVDEIDLLLANEMKAHGNEADVMLCMKVINVWKSYVNGYNKTFRKLNLMKKYSIYCMFFFRIL